MMGALQFLIIVNIFNIHLKVVQLKDLTGDHHVEDISKSISNIYAERVPSQNRWRFPKSSRITQNAFNVGWEDDEIPKHSLSPPAEAVITIPIDLNSLLEPTVNSSNRHHLSSIRSLTSLPPCKSDQFACADGTKCIPESYRCDDYVDCNDGSDQSESLCTPPCSADMFPCADQSQCIPRSKVCSGYVDGCRDLSHTLASQCDNCAADHLFKCQISRFDICLNVAQLLRCDGLVHCDNLGDELVSECPNCVNDPSMFKCKIIGGEVCLKKSQYQCNGYPLVCDGYSSNLPTQCDDCAADHLFKCKQHGVDFCINSDDRCDGVAHCDNLADELISECPNCVADQSMFTCKKNGLEVCLKKSRYQCNGYAAQSCQLGKRIKQRDVGLSLVTAIHL